MAQLAMPPTTYTEALQPAQAMVLTPYGPGTFVPPYASIDPMPPVDAQFQEPAVGYPF